MNKLQCLIDQMDGLTVTLIDMKILFVLFKKSFLDCKQIASELNDEFNEYEVLDAITRLRHDPYGLIDKSSNSFLLSSKGDEVVEASAKTWFEINFPDAKPSNGGRFKRPITSTMESFKDQIYCELDGDLREHTISRQNFKIKFHNQKSGFKWVEVRNAGNFRIVVGKKSINIIDEIKKMDGVVEISTTDSSSILKFDFPLNHDVIEKMTSFIKPFLK